MTARDTILELLTEHGPLYGLDLVRLSKGALRRGTVYVHLSRLEDEGLVLWRPGELSAYIGAPRRRYEITEDGRRQLAGDGGLLPEGSPC